MEHTGLSTQLDQFRHSIVSLRDNLDQMLGQIEDFDTLVDRTAEEARAIYRTFGRPRPPGGLLSMGFLPLLGIGALGLYIFAPDTFHRIYNQVRQFVSQQGSAISQQSGAMRERAQERFGQPPHS